MGMYTELVLKIDIKRNLPDQVYKVLEYLFTESDIPSELDIPEHEFFKCTRWKDIGSSNSYYHIPKTFNYYDREYLFSRSDLKNYEDEIDKFIDWINPYINCCEGKCIGWHWYEGSDSPTLIFKK